MIDWIACTPESPGPDYEIFSQNPTPYLVVTKTGAIAIVHPVYKKDPDGKFELKYWSTCDSAHLLSASSIRLRAPITLPGGDHYALMVQADNKDNVYAQIKNSQMETKLT